MVNTMNDTTFDRWKKKLKTENISDPQCQELIGILQERIGEKPLRQIVASKGYSEQQLQHIGQIQYGMGRNRGKQETTDYYEGDVRPYLEFSTHLHLLRNQIAVFIAAPDVTPSSLTAFLGKPLRLGEGEELSWADIFMRLTTDVEKAQLRLDPDGQNHEAEFNPIGEAALIRQELIKFENAVEKRDKTRQAAAIKELRSILSENSGVAIQRIFEMRADKKFGGNPEGVTPHMRELRNEVNIVKDESPNMTAREIIDLLLMRREKQVQDEDGRYHDVPIKPDNELERKQIDSLKKGRKRPSRYLNDLLK